MLTLPAPLLGRAIFAGVPFTAVLQVLETCESAADWSPRLVELARRFVGVAGKHKAAGAAVSACAAWQAAAASYQAATLSVHLNPDDCVDTSKIIALRKRARRVYSRALSLHPHWRSVTLASLEPRLAGVLRMPVRETDHLVVLLNGLDSISDAEMHGFGNVFLERGAAVLALDVPGAFSYDDRPPTVSLANLNTGIADWVSENLPGVRHLHAFGISYGGLLAAHLLAGNSRYENAVALSPPAWMPDVFFRERRLKSMLAALFRVTVEEVETMVRPHMNVGIEHLPAPLAPLKIYATAQDILFPRSHVDAFRRWGRKKIEVHQFAGEHAGTTQFHWLIPDAADWLLRPQSRGCTVRRLSARGN